MAQTQAARGFEASGQAPVRAELAYREANTIALFGDALRAQVRAGAAIAYLMKGSLDGTAGQLGPVLELPPDQRIRTVTGYLDEISGMIRAPRFAGSPLAAQLGEQIREFTTAGVTA